MTESKTDGTRKVKHMVGLPISAGFYWQKSKERPWRIIRVFNQGNNLTCDDISHNNFSGRPLDFWENLEPLGEWVEIKEPNATGEPR